MKLSLAAGYYINLIDYSLPGAIIASPLTSVTITRGKKQAGSNPGKQTAATTTKGTKRKAVEPEALIVTGKRARKAARNPDGNVYNVVETSRRGGRAGRGGGVRRA
jgi:hypothetical protein